MRLLVIDSATDACSVALFEDGGLLAGDLHLLGRGHAEALVPMIAALPGRGKADRIAVSQGPGSFTGVRVGLAAARALQLAWGSALIGYSTLALVAAMARHQRGPQALAVAMTGGHGEWFVQRFADTGTALGPGLSLTPALAVQECTEELIAGSQAAALVSTRGHGAALPLLPDARHLDLLPEAAFSHDPHPVYGRGPDARLPGQPPRDATP